MCADHDLYFFDLRELVTQFIFLSISMAADIVKAAKDISHEERSRLRSHLTMLGSSMLQSKKEGMKVDCLSDLFEAVHFNQVIIHAIM